MQLCETIASLWDQGRPDRSVNQSSTNQRSNGTSYKPWWINSISRPSDHDLCVGLVHYLSIRPLERSWIIYCSRAIKYHCGAARPESGAFWSIYYCLMYSIYVRDIRWWKDLRKRSYSSDVDPALLKVSIVSYTSYSIVCRGITHDSTAPWRKKWNQIYSDYLI